MKRTSKISRRIVATLLGSALGTCFCSAIMLDAEMLFAGIAMLTLSLVIAAIIY